MTILDRKLSELEENVISDEIDESKIHLDFSEFPEAEQELHRYVLRILQGTNPNNPLNISNLSPNEKELLEKSSMLLCQRVFALFRNTLQLFCCINENSGYNMQFQTRFGWFLNECLKLGMQSLDMKKLEKENAGLDEDALDEKQIELENKQPTLFSQESFDKYESELLRKMFERHQAKHPELTQQLGEKQP